jgi:hypothetical protein
MSRPERKSAVPLPKPSAPVGQTNPPTNQPLPTSLSRDVGAVPAAATSVPEVKEEEMTKWMDELYNTINMSAEELKQYWDAFAYQGFNRSDVVKQLRQVIPDVKIASQIIVLIAMRGPQGGSNIKLLNGKTPLEMGIPASGGQGTHTLTCNKILSATADLAAAFLKKMNAPKRIDSPLPGWLQFPSAGSIKLPEHIRRLHEDFSRSFSQLIGGNFQFQIYQQMVNNAYLDPKLHLFDSP